MKIKCECGGEEFVATVTGLIDVFCDPSGKIILGMVGDVSHGQSHAGVDNEYICVQCGNEATIQND